MELFSKLKEAAAVRTEAVRVATERAKAELQPALREFITTFPEIHQLRWAQYTPYFNDGEACEFGVGDVEFRLSASDDDDDGWLDTWGEYDSGAGISRAAWNALQDLSKYLQSAEDECLAVFGDHVRVVVSAEGVEVDEYDHD